MSYFSNAQDTQEQFGKYIAEFQELFRANDVSFGSAEDLFRLAPRLARDESFREGFTSLSRSVQKREDGRLTLTRMLTIVAIASGGDGIANVGDEGTVPVSLLVVFLAGLNGWNETDSVLAGAAAQDAAAGGTGNDNNGGGSAATASKTEDDRAAELEQRLIDGPEEDIGTLTTTLFGGPMQVKEALGRLEMNTIEMRMHLDSIASKVERIEPHLNELKTRIAVPAKGARKEDPVTVPVPPMKPWPRPEEETPRPEWAASAPPMRPWPTEKEEDLVWEPKTEEKISSPRVNWPAKKAEPVWRGPLRERERTQDEEVPARGRTLAQGAAPLRLFADEESEEDDEDLPIRVPFEEYLDEEEGPRWGRRLATAAGVMVITLAVVAGFFYRSHGWHGYQDGVQTIGAALANAKADLPKWTAGQRASTSSSAMSQSATTGAAQAATGTLQEQAASTALPALPPTQTAQAGAVSPMQPTSGNAAQSTPKAPATPNQPAAAESETSAPPAEHDAGSSDAKAGSTKQGQDEPVKRMARPVVMVLAGSGVAPSQSSTAKLPLGMHSTVPVFVDVARLAVVSDPRPAYPRDALARGIEGDVVVQANISRNGDVESAQIVSGPAGLLKPSLDAVREWQFRPYRVHGEPAEARTYVRFQYRTEH